MDMPVSLGGGGVGWGNEGYFHSGTTNPLRNSPRKNHHWDSCPVKNFVEAIPKYLLNLLLFEAFLYCMSYTVCKTKSWYTQTTFERTLRNKCLPVIKQLCDIT